MERAGMKRATEKVLKKMAGNGYPEVREALDEIEQLREENALLTKGWQPATPTALRDEIEQLRGLLYDVWDAAPYLGAELNRRVREALGDE
jgi:hypothetical protein